MFEPLIKHITNFSPMNSKCVLTFKFRAQAIFNAAKKDTLPALENLSLQNLFVYSTLQVPKTIYINQTFHDKDGFVKFKTHFEFMGEKFVVCFINGPKSENFKSFKEGRDGGDTL